MENETKIYLELSEDILKELVEREIDLKEVLEEQNIGSKIIHEPSPFASDYKVKTMDISLAIVIGIGISTWLTLDRVNAILKTILNRTIVYNAKKPMENPKTGEVIKEKGKIKTTPVKIHESTVKNEKSEVFIDLIKVNFFVKSESTIENKGDK